MNSNKLLKYIFKFDFYHFHSRLTILIEMSFDYSKVNEIIGGQTNVFFIWCHKITLSYNYQKKKKPIENLVFLK